MHPNWPHALADRIGVRGIISFTPARVGLTLHVPCEKGGHVVDVPVRSGLPPDVIAKQMLNKGWSFGSRLSCPECGRRRAKSNPDSKKIAMSTTDKPQASDAARKAKRLVYQALEDAYDDVAKRYRNGWSDDRVAKETGAAPAFVKQIREQDFGPLGEPVELASLRHEVDALRAEASASNADLIRRVDALAQKLTNICRQNGWPIT